MLEYAFLTVGSLYASVVPIAAIPTFLALTSNDTPQQRRSMARTACMICAGVMALFALLGPALFKMFGLTLPAFQVAGGLVLLLSALDMIRAQKSPLKETPEEFAEGMNKDSIAVTPLAVPLLAGPGAITTSIVLGQRAATVWHKAVVFALIALVAFVTYWTLTLAADSAKKFSPTILNIITRLMGLLLAAIGVQFILSALKLG